jgi:hypothetical protein
MLTSLHIRKNYAGIKLFSKLPSTIKSLNHDIKVLKPGIKYLLCHSFNCVKELPFIGSSEVL